jgi:hypothetical protein
MIQIELQPEVEARLRAEASRHGQALDVYITCRLSQSAAHAPYRKSAAEIEAAVEKMVRRRSRHKLPAGETISSLIREGRRY